MKYQKYLGVTFLVQQHYGDFYALKGVLEEVHDRKMAKTTKNTIVRTSDMTWQRMGYKTPAKAKVDILGRSFHLEL